MSTPVGRPRIRNENLVWDTNTLTWVSMLQPSTTGGGGGGGAVTIADGADVAQGSRADAAWVSGSGTVISLLKKIASAGGSAVSIADGSDVAEGTTTDAAVTTDVNGTVSGKLRGLVKISNSVWDSANGRLKVDGSAVTQPVSAASLPLPTGAATSGLQTTGNTSVASIDTKTPALGQAAMAASQPVVIASDQSGVPTVNSTVTATGTVNVTGAGNLVISGLSGMGSLAVQTIQTGYAGSGTGIAAYDISADGGTNYTNAVSFISGANATTSFTTQANVNRLHYIPLHGGVTNVRLRITQAGQGSLAVTAVAGTKGLSVPADTLLSNQGTAAATATAWPIKVTDGTSISAVKAASTAAVATDPALVVRSIQLPAAVGQTTMSASLPVTIASDQSAVPVSGTVTTSPPANASTNLAQVGGASVSLGQQLAAASVPVILPSATITTLTPPAAITGYALESGHIAAVDAAQGTVADAAWVSGSGTVVSLLKKIASAGGSAVSVADGADIAQGTTTDLASASTVIGLLKNLKAALAGSLTVSQATGTNLHVVVDSAPSTAVTGNVTVVQATGTNLHTVTDSGSVVAATLSAETTKVIGTVNVAAAQTIAVTQATGTNLHAVIDTGSTTAVTQATPANLQATVTPITLTKGTQGATGFSTQDLKDSGRVNIMWTAEFSPIGTAEAMLTMTESRDGAAVTTASSKVVTSGKRLRITSIDLVVENTLGVNPKRGKLRMKFNTAGAVTTASPLQGSWAASVSTAVNTIGQTMFADFPDGIEYLGDGTKQIGFSLESPDWVSAAQTSKVYITVFAFEY